MRKEVIGKDCFTGKSISKLRFEKGEKPSLQLFSSGDVIVGNPHSNVACAFIYSWKTDQAPKEVRDFFVKVSNYCALTGFWRTTNGARYAFSNILANPNINKLVVFTFGVDDNGHLLVDSLKKFWLNGVDGDGVIKDCDAPNPKFEQVPLDALERLKEQVDLLVLRKADFSVAEELVRSSLQEPENAVDPDDIVGLEHYSDSSMIYDCGARFDEPFVIDLASGARSAGEFKVGDGASGALHAKDLSEGVLQAADFIFKNGSMFVDDRGVRVVESRSFTITVDDALGCVPDGFCKDYISKYVGEFMKGVGERLEDFSYTYNGRIFKRWGNQVDKVVEILKANPTSRRAMISLWDQKVDLGNSNPPCLDLIWAVLRDGKLEFHVVYRSHHLATVTENGDVMPGEGAFVPNLFAIATLQQNVAEKLSVSRGSLSLTDFSGHLYVAGV